MISLPFRKLSILIISIFLLNGCTVGPNYKKPSVAIPAQYKEAQKGWKIASPQDEEIRGEWWESFHDSELNALEEQLNRSNQNVEAAEANYRQALWLVKQARSNYFPTITGIGSIFRQTELPTRFPPEFNYSVTNTVEGLLLNTSWEPDVWGKIHRLVESRTAEAQASAAQLAAIKLSSQATLAQYYFELRTLDRDQVILDSTVASYQDSFRIANEGYKSGHAAYTDVIQAESLLEVAKAQATHNGINRAQYEHAIATLIGVPPAYLTIKPKPLRASPPSVPIQVPSTLLERRPDIAQAEREMAQANAKIGIAVSAYYPDIALSGSGGLFTNGFAPLFSTSAHNFAVGVTLAETLFDAGNRYATTQAARANYDATVASYRQTVLSAFQEVEDNLSASRILEQEYEHRKLAEKNARLALKLIMDGYKSGMNSYTDVIVAQTNAYQAEKDSADVSGLRMTAAVGLFKALGGGWKGLDIN